VDAERLWAAQTQRSLEHFRISGERMPRELIAALVSTKRAAAQVNRELGLLEPRLADAIERAADEVLEGRHADEFPLVVWQTGSGTQTNMNVNEVLANRSSELLGGPRGKGRLVHPNDHVNMGQSSNDVFPTAMHVAAAVAVTSRLLPALSALATELGGAGARYQRPGEDRRTHLQDATPLTLGQEFSGYAAQLRIAIEAITVALKPVHELALGGTARRAPGLNTHPEFGARVAARLAARHSLPFASAPNKFAALAGTSRSCSCTAR
jgi:fumarate hydratase class II